MLHFHQFSQNSAARSACRAVAVALFCALFAGSAVQAKIELIASPGRAVPGQPFQAELRYDATDRLALIRSMEGTDFLEFEGERLERPGPRPNALAEGTLLATPGISHFDPKQWHVVATVEAFADGSAIHASDASGAVQLHPIQMGSIHGVRVQIDPGAVRDAQGNPRRAAQIRISVQGPNASYNQVPMLSAKDAESSARVARAAFLNGDTLLEFPARDTALASRATRALPAPPGDYRINYQTGGRLMRVSPSDIGTTTTEIGFITLDHHGNGVRIGSTIGDDFWFYAPRRVTRLDKTDSVFASVATLKPLEQLTRDAFNTLSPQGTEVPLERTRRYDENHYYERLLSTTNERFVYSRSQSATTETLQLLLSDLLTSTAVTLSTEIYGYNQSSVTPDHYADMTLGGVAAPRTSWKGRTLHLADFSLSLPAIPSPGTLTFEHAIPTGSPFNGGIDYQDLEAMELTWTGKPRADNGEWGTIDLPAAGNGQPRRVTMGGFPVGTVSGDVIVLDVTVTTSPIELVDVPVFPDGSGGVAVEFEAPPEAASFHIEHVDAITMPLLVTPAEVLPDDLPGSTVLKAIYVRPAMFDAALQPLIDHRGAANIIELDPWAAYNAYNGGQESPDAIRDAIRDIVTRHQYRLPLPNVFLVGHASLDPRDYMGTQVESQVPCFIEYGVSSSVGILENSVDYTYALLFGDDDIVDAILGRWPAKSVADVQRAVQRNLRHDDILVGLRSQNRPGLFVCDDEQQFLDDQPMWQQKWELSGLPATRVDLYTTSSVPQAQADIASAFSNPGGVTFAMYIGHGNLDTWAGEKLMTVSSTNAIPTINTDDQWPIVGVFTCLNGYYAFPGSSTLCMSEAWLFSTDYGAVANIAPVGVDYYFEQRLYALAVLEMFGRDPSIRPRTIGELMALVQVKYATNYAFFYLTNHEYILFGDPQTNLAMDPPIVTGVEDWRLW